MTVAQNMTVKKNLVSFVKFDYKHYLIVKEVVLKTLTSTFFSLLILNIFIFFYHHQLGKNNPNNITDVVWYPNQFSSNMEEGFSWFSFDKNGFNNAFPVKKNEIDILIVGSSHIESVYTHKEENMCFFLNRMLPEYYVYNIGIAGHYLPRSIKNLSDCYNYYKTIKFYLIETITVQLELDEIKSVLNGRLSKILLDRNKAILFIKNYVPTFKSFCKKIVDQLSLWKERSSMSIFNKNSIFETSNFDEKGKTEYCEVLNSFLAFARKSVPDNIPLIIFYHPSYTLQQDGSIKNNTDKWYLESFEKACKNNNIIFIDTDQDFQELYKTKHILPYGFINTKVGVGHLNKYGHEVIAKRLAKEITNVLK